MKKHIQKEFLNKNGQSLETHFLLTTVLLIVMIIFASSPIAVDLMDAVFAKNEEIYQKKQNEKNVSNSIETDDYEVIIENNTITVNGELDKEESIVVVGEYINENEDIVMTNTLSNFNIEFLRENKKIECYNCYIEMQGKYYYVKTKEQEYWVKPEEIQKLEKVE